jgi:hypothetical protein
VIIRQHSSGAFHFGKQNREDTLNQELSQLILLQDTDLELRRLKEEIESLPVRQERIERQFAESNKEFLALKHELETAHAKRRRLETDLEDEQRKQQKFKDDLMKARNEREYTTALREIDVARKAVSALETEILKLMEQTEKLEAQVKERTPAIEAQRQEVDRQLAESRAAVDISRQKLAKLNGERAALFETLGPNAQAVYNRLSRLRSGTPLAEARDYSCQACRMTIRPQVFADIKRAETIITCESCGRILYFKLETVTT